MEPFWTLLLSVPTISSRNDGASMGGVMSNPITIRKPSPPVGCKHKNLRGPVVIGENGAYCVDCDEPRPCQHPVATQVEFLGGDSVTQCAWCGEDLLTTQ